MQLGIQACPRHYPLMSFPADPERSTGTALHEMVPAQQWGVLEMKEIRPQELFAAPDWLRSLIYQSAPRKSWCPALGSAINLKSLSITWIWDMALSRQVLSFVEWHKRQLFLPALNLLR